MGRLCPKCVPVCEGGFYEQKEEKASATRRKRSSTKQRLDRGWVGDPAEKKKHGTVLAPIESKQCQGKRRGSNGI